MGSARQRTLVGLFVLVAFGILFATVLSLTGGIGASRVPMKTYFHFSGGLDAGGVVRYGGLAIGKITRVRVDPVDSTRIEVDFAVDPTAPVKTDSLARISQMGLLSDNFLELSPGAPGSASATAGTVLRSKESMGLDELEDTVAALLPQTQKTISSLNSDLDAVHETINRTNDFLSASNRAKVSSALNNLDRTLAELRPELNKTIGNLNGALSDSDKAVKSADSAIAHVDGVVTENQNGLRSSVESLALTLAQTKSLIKKLNSTVDQNSDNLDEALENIRQATEDLRQLTGTLKTSPASIIRGTGTKERKPGGLK